MAAIPLDLLDRIRALEQQVRELTGRAQTRPALDKILHGDVTVGEGGRLLVQDPDGTHIFETGQAPQGDWFVRLRRDTGAVALGVGANTYTGDDTRQMVRMFSRTGQAVVMDDYYADEYLGRPSIPIPWQPTTTVSSTATAPVTAWLAAQRVQCAVFYLTAEMWCPANTTVTAELEFRGPGDAGYESWQTWTATAGAAGKWESLVVARPMHRIAHFSHVTWRLRHHVVKGTGTVVTQVIGSYQRNTQTAAETPDPPVQAAAQTPALFAAPLPEPAPDTAAPPNPGPGLHPLDE
ncbi:hypothetical protein [Streptomyces sp. NPDC051561]|uniref:hypothetical protein n=1 Tax=Streptomyces sp. NPDC051561 TaxID=3365658 RepID=UPI0037941FCF